MGWIAFIAFLIGFAGFSRAALRSNWSDQVTGWGSLASGVVLMSIVLALGGLDDPPKPPPVPLTAAEQRAALIEKQFSPWDGAHRNLEARVKASMNDPDSYDHIETKYQDRGEYVFLRMKFRGANLFGGKVVSEVMATADVDGTLLTVNMIEP